VILGFSTVELHWIHKGRALRAVRERQVMIHKAGWDGKEYGTGRPTCISPSAYFLKSSRQGMRLLVLKIGEEFPAPAHR